MYRNFLVLGYLVEIKGKIMGKKYPKYVGTKIRELRETVEDMLDADEHLGLCNFIKINCRENEEVYSGACHWDLKYWGGVDNPQYVLDYVMYSSIEEEYYKAFVDYIVNRSAYRYVFVEKDVDTIFSQKVNVVSTKFNVNLIAGALIALRGASEFPNFVISWINFINQGFDEHVAYCLSFALVNKGVGVVKNNMCGHAALNYLTIKKKTIKAYIKHCKELQPDMLNQKMSEFNGYDNIHTFFFVSDTDINSNDCAMYKLLDKSKVCNSDNKIFKGFKNFKQQYLGDLNSKRVDLFKQLNDDIVEGEIRV